MGLIGATFDAIGGTLADQWKDFLTVPADIAPNAALFPAVPSGTNAGRGSNTKGSFAVVTNGSKIVVPEGYGLLVFQEGGLTGFTDVPGGYTWNSDDINSKSFIAGDNASLSLLRQSWERLKFGGRPGAQQSALFVNLKELPNNKFGTSSTVYWDDAYLRAQVGAIAHGTYSIRIIDPLLFVKQFVPATYLQAQEVFDFTDRNNPASLQLFSEVVASLAAAFSSYTNDPQKANRIANIQQDSLGFAQTLAQVVDGAYAWSTTRGLAISKVTIVGLEYDESTKELLKSVQRADALSGARGNANLAASVAAGIETAGGVSGAGGILGIGIAGNSVGLGSLMQTGVGSVSGTEGPEDLIGTLQSLKKALDAGLITQADFDAAKAQALGLKRD
jgi:membrane protease subunit (stomatin/prohibitin family)